MGFKKLKSPAPKGKREVMAALIEAASMLFAAKGPSQVSVREIADRAKVNHGLVHRHFGSKGKLLKAVMEDLSARLAIKAVRPLDPSDEDILRLQIFQNLSKNEAYVKILARSLLDGEPLEDIQDRFPVIEDLIQFANRKKDAGSFDEDTDPRAVIAYQVASVMGWLTFERYLLASTGLGQEGTEKARAIFLDLARKAAASFEK